MHDKLHEILAELESKGVSHKAREWILSRELELTNRIYFLQIQETRMKAQLRYSKDAAPA